MSKYLIEISRSVKSRVSTGGSEAMPVREEKWLLGPCWLLAHCERPGWGLLAGCRAGLGKESQSTSEKFLALLGCENSPSFMLLFSTSLWRQSLPGSKM